MVDPLSTAASAIAILQLSSKVVQYIRTASDASKDRRRIREAVRACEDVLQQLKDADDSDESRAWSETVKALEEPGAPLGRLFIVLGTIEDRLTSDERAGKIGAAIKWPFKEKEVDRMIAIIEHEKSLLILALQNNSRRLIQEIKKTSEESKRQLLELTEMAYETKQNFEDVRRGVRRIEGFQNMKEREAVLDWLTAINYAPQQQDYIKLRQPGTGQWLLESPRFQAWLQRKQTLFCPGIPGAGKTVLTAIVIDHLTKQYHANPDVGIAYVYCNFRQKVEQTHNQLLATLLRQLAERRMSVPKDIKELYEMHNSKKTRPSTDELKGALQSIADSYSRVFVVVDALDECQMSDGCCERFIEDCFALQGRCHANLFMTSRFLPEITEKFNNASTFEIRAAPEDVEKYLAGQVVRLPKVVRKDSKVQEEIKNAIVDAVDGM